MLRPLRTRQSRTFGSGSAGVLPAPRSTHRAVALLALALALTGCSTGHPTGALGAFPSFLPRSTLTSGALHRVVDASASDPALATQGDAVRVHLGAGAVLVRVAGPEVPNEGLPVQAHTSPATWTVTLSGAVGAVPLDPATFQAVDEHGRIYRLDLLAQPPLPTSVPPGATVRFRLFAAHFAVGQGRLRWIPTGHLAPVEWDFTVEVD